MVIFRMCVHARLSLGGTVSDKISASSDSKAQGEQQEAIVINVSTNHRVQEHECDESKRRYPEEAVCRSSRLDPVGKHPPQKDHGWYPSSFNDKFQNEIVRIEDRPGGGASKPTPAEPKRMVANLLPSN